MADAFILLATQRTGSSWVQEMLGSHSQAKVYNELFVADAYGRPFWPPSDVEFFNTFAERSWIPLTGIGRSWVEMRYLQYVFGQSDSRVIGFKCMYDQFRDHPGIGTYAAVRRTKVVHLVRYNLLDVVISARMAQRTGLYHVAGDDRPAVPWWPAQNPEAKVTLEVAPLLRELAGLTRERARMRRRLHALRIPHIEVIYETLRSDRREFGRILGFLKLAPEDAGHLKSGLQRLRTKPQAAAVENFPEVRAALGGTPYERFVEG